MQIRRFIVAQIPEAGAECILPPVEALHAGKVLRLGPGDRIDLLDGAGTRAEAVLTAAGAGRRFEGMACRVTARQAVPAPALRVRLYLAPPRARLMGDAVRIATELGVRRLTPILCRYSVSRPDAAAAAGWLQDAEAAMKQSGNPFRPRIDPPRDLAAALRDAAEPGVFGAVPRAGAPVVAPAAVGGDVGLWIGPEGGFTDEEEAALAGHGLAPLSVGPWILRVETAVPALLGRLWGDRGHA